MIRHCWSLLVLLLAVSAVGAETVLYRAQWGDKGLDGWTVNATEKTAVNDPKLGPTLIFPGGGATSPKLQVAGNHRIRLRYAFSKRKYGVLYCSLKQYGGGKDVGGFHQLWAQDPNIADSSPMELGFLTEPDADTVEIIFGTGASAEQRVTLSNFTVVDLGPAPPLKVDGKEYLPDPGWEGYAPRTELEQENSYFQGPGWMGWAARDASRVITRIPSRVHGGQQALMVRTGANGQAGFRFSPAVPTVEDGWYDFSFWAKGEGMVTPYVLLGGPYGDHYAISSAAVLLSPDDWRHLHIIYNADNPAHKGFTMGLLALGRTFIDDMSVKQVTPEEGMKLRDNNRQWFTPPNVQQSVPAGENRPRDEAILENNFLRVKLTPVGGYVTEVTDKTRNITWTGAWLGLDFPTPPVPVLWSIPFRTERTADTVTFSHTATGGAAAPFIDGIRIEQIFHLGPDDRKLSVTYRLTNTAHGARLPNPAVRNSWAPALGVQRLSAAGDAGEVVTDKVDIHITNLIAGWMAASTAKGSLVWGFDVTAAQGGPLDPINRLVGWDYLRLMLPPGGTWETQAWLAPVDLPAVDAATASTAIMADLAGDANGYALTLRTAALTSTPVTARGRVVDYGGAVLGATEFGEKGGAKFVPQAGRFITAVDIKAGTSMETLELFNDPGARTPEAGIQGSGQIQYRPPVPARVMRLPGVGDARKTISASKSILWAYGLYSQYYPLEKVLKAQGYTVEISDSGNAFPEEVEELFPYRAVILSNLGAIQLTAQARAALSQYVRAGGRLLVIGGSLSLGNAQTTGTDLEDLLPATLTGPYDAQPLASTAQLLAPTPTSGLGALPWADKPHLYWAHRLTARPSAAVLLKAGNTPVLLQGNCELGKTLLFSGTVEGDPAPGDLPAWEWKGWSDLWAAVVRRLVTE
ncbi:MAG TPA: glutamine amidotransferase [Armatimonadota bacterium]